MKKWVMRLGLLSIVICIGMYIWLGEEMKEGVQQLQTEKPRI